MAKTKFLDYTGLAKLVEKIKNTYVNKNEQYEANLKWGGGNFADSFGPIDGAMIPELGANRFAFGYPNGITIEYSNDGGNTWKDYGADPVDKGRLLSDGYPFKIGKVKSANPANDMLRVTLNTTVDGINCYTFLNKFCIYISSQGSDGCYCTIQIAKQETPTVFLNKATNVPLYGWSGYNIINIDGIYTSYGDLSPELYGRIRFIFGCTGNTTNYPGMAINKIYAFGGAGWNIPSNMAANGHLYSYDYNQNATFPANITATNFIGTLQGNANSASKLGTATVGSATKPMYISGGTPTECTYTLAQNVTSTSKLTDTTYSASTGLSLSKDNKFSINAATSSTIGGVKIGSGITVDTGGTISLTKTNVTNALGYTPPTADTNTTYTFTSGTGGTFTVKASNSNSGQTVSVGVPAKASAATSAETAATAEKVGSETVGSATQPIYLSGGTPTKCTYTLAQNVTSASKLTDHLYNAGEGLELTNGTTADTFSLSAATSSTIGGVKIGNNITVSDGTISLTKGNVVNALGYTPPTADTNTTYTFTNGTDGTFTVKASNSTKAQTISVGKTASSSTADNAVNAQTAETANKLSVNAGSDMTPIYFKDGVPKPCDSTLGVNINGRANYASLADKLPINAGSASVDDVLVIGNYSGGPIHMGGGVGPGEFTPTDIIEKDGDYYLLNVSKANTANSASKLNIGTTGTPTKPVYFNNGVPATCTYELNKTVPSTAVFTDTKYTLSGDGTNKVTITDSNNSSQSITINNVQSATYANQYLYNGMGRDFVYDAAEGNYHYIKCEDDTIISADRMNLNRYEFIINADGTGRWCIYDKGISMGTFWGVDGMVFEKAPENSLVAAKGTFATAISDTDIKNEINSAIDWTQAL